MLVLTNCPRFPENWESETGLQGQALILHRWWEFARHARHAEFILINCDVALTFQLCALFRLLPFLRRPMVVHDLILREPRSLRHRITAPLKRFLLARVDHFIHHFRDLQGYRKYYGVGPERSSFTPFKPNFRYRQTYKVGPDGDYVLCFGRSERDYDTFFDALARLPYPALIPPPDFSKLRQHGARFRRPISELPPNVRIAEDDGSPVAIIRMIEGARLVVMPILKSRIGPSGIGTCLNAMLLGKCVIGSEGVCASDIFTDEVLLVPPEDPEALAVMIRRAWEDRELRERTALAGQRYAEACGGEADVHRRMFENAMCWYVTTPRGQAALARLSPTPSS
jgi:glycosyltransferase involved in cell wall biosynthesis